MKETNCFGQALINNLRIQTVGPYNILRLYGSGRLAQLGEHNVRNVGVGGSNPLPSTKSFSPIFTTETNHMSERLQVGNILTPQLPLTSRDLYFS
jgi:hypothetical protein